LGDLQKAEKHQRLAIEHAPKKVNPYGALALVLRQRGAVDEARALNAKAKELAPNYPDWDAKRAAYFLRSYPTPSRWVQKEALFHAAIAAQATEVKNLSYVTTLVEAYAANQKYPQAIQVLQDSLQSADASISAEQRAQLQRSLAQYQALSKKAPEKKD
jgi:hypothetical protein